MRTGNERRDFIKQGLFLAGAAGVLASGLAPIAARAQVVSKPVRRPDRYEDSFIFERKPYTWPKDACDLDRPQCGGLEL